MPTGYLFRNAEVYAPEHLGRKDILVVGQKIIAIDNHIDAKVPGLGRS